MKKKLILSKQILRILSNNEIRLVGGGGSLNCTNPTSMQLIEGCIQESGSGCPAAVSGQPDCR